MKCWADIYARLWIISYQYYKLSLLVWNISRNVLEAGTVPVMAKFLCEPHDPCIGRCLRLISAAWRVFLHPLDGMLVQRTVTPKNDIHQYSFVDIAVNWHSENSVPLKSTTHSSWPGLEPRMLNAKASALITAPPIFLKVEVTLILCYHVKRV